MMINRAVDIYKRIDETDWKNFGAAVATVGPVLEDAGAIIETGIGKFGGSKAKAALKDVKLFINKQKARLDKLEGDARELWNKLEKTAKDKAGAVAALANGFPVTLNGEGRLTIHLGKHKVLFADPELQKALKAIFENGRYILNDLDGRGEGALEELAGLPPAKLKAKLVEALRGAVKELPPDIAKSIKDLPKDATERAKAALERFQDHVLGGRMSEESQRLLAQALAGGMLFVKEGDVVVVIERPFAEEARKLEARLEAYGRRVAEGAIGKVVSKISEIRDDLEQKGQKLIRANNNQALDVLAKEVPDKIKEVKEQVRKLKDEIEIARGELADKEEDRMVVDYEAKAARLLADEAGTLVEQAKLYKKRAALVVKQAKLAAEVEVLRGEQADALISAAKAKVAKLEDAVRHRFDRCMANGVNPLSEKASEPERLPLPTASLRGVLSGHLSLLDVVNRPVVEAAAFEALGMIQWCEMLGLSGSKKTPADYYAALVFALASSDPIWTTAKAEQVKSVGGRIEVIGNVLSRLFNAKAGVNAEVHVAGGKVMPENIAWRNGAGNRSKEVENCIQDLPEEFRKMVLGVFRYRVTISGADRASFPATTRDVFPVAKVLPVKSASYFVDLDKVYLIADRPNIFFVLIPPAVARARLGSSMIYGPLAQTGVVSKLLKLRDADQSEPSIAQQRQIEKDLGLLKGVNFTGALGAWTIIVLDSDAEDPTRRANAIKAIKRNGSFTLRMYYLPSDVLSAG